MTESRTRLRFVPGTCVDRAGGEHAARFTSLELLETRAGRPLLLEHRQGHDLLVIENVHADGAFWVFELIVNGERLRRYRIPRGAGSGQLELGTEFSTAGVGSGFRARLSVAHLRCTLLLLPLPAADSANGSSGNEPQ